MVGFYLIILPPDLTLLLQVLPLGVHYFHVFAITDKTTPGARQDASLVARPSRSVDRPHYHLQSRSGVLKIDNVSENAPLRFSPDLGATVTEKRSELLQGEYDWEDFFAQRQP